ncbi:MAG: YqiA/YcfP family alpha/beta fold hydrolase [Burkholderiaceae bacterium]
MIVYLHGFRSSPASRKTTMLRERMTALGLADHYLCPALPASPLASIETVIAMVKDVEPAGLALIGSSLGGYYATALAEKIGCRAALLNPAIAPYRDLRDHVGVRPVYFSQETIDFRAEYLDELQAIDVERITRPERYFLLAATGDAVIDYRSMVARFAGARQRVIEGSDHELSDFAQYMDEVLQFCGVDVQSRIGEGA